MKLIRDLAFMMFLLVICYFAMEFLVIANNIYLEEKKQTTREYNYLDELNLAMCREKLESIQREKRENDKKYELDKKELNDKLKNIEGKLKKREELIDYIIFQMDRETIKQNIWKKL